MSEIVAKIRDGIARVGWSETARRTNIARAQLWRNFKEGGNPKLETIAAVLPHVGLELTVQEVRPCHSPH